MRVLLAGGGTGGHVIPALAIAHELAERYSAQVIFVGTSRGIESRLVPAAGFELRLVRVGQLKGVSTATRLRTLLDLPRAVVDSWHILAEFDAQVVVGVGGYASGPAMLAAVLAGVPILAFEPNYIPGFANRVAAGLDAPAAVQFPVTCRYFRRCQVTGVPVRREFFAAAGKSDPTPTLLVFGGSQGARAINRVLFEALPDLRQRLPRLHVIHQTGEGDYNEAQSVYLRTGISAEIHPFIENMPEAFARAHLLVCRSGASTVAEVAAAGKAAIFVPFPRATDDHQRRNAEALAGTGAARLLLESELSAERLVDEVVLLLSDSGQRVQMEQAARRIAHPHAAAQIARLAARLAGMGDSRQETD